MGFFSFTDLYYAANIHVLFYIHFAGIDVKEAFFFFSSSESVLSFDDLEDDEKDNVKR